jgi:hypothetical protein
VIVSEMPLRQFVARAAQLGWAGSTAPIAPSHGNWFALDCGVTDRVLLSVFLREGADVYRTYTTTAHELSRSTFLTGFLDPALDDQR